MRRGLLPLNIGLLTLLITEGGSIIPAVFTATIFDLARRGFLKIRDERKVKSGFFGAKISYQSTLIKNPNPQDQLKDYEKKVLSLLFKTTSHDTDELPFEKIKKWMRDNPFEFQNWFREFESKIKKAGAALGFLEKEGKEKMKKFWLVTIILFILTLNFPLLILALFLIPRLKRRKYEWAKKEQLWHRFKIFLNDFSNFKELPPQALILWDQYLVYGVLFGVADKILKALPAILAQPQALHPTWYIAAESQTFNAADVSLLTHGLSNLTSSLTSSTTTAAHFSSGGGGGGGAS